MAASKKSEYVARESLLQFFRTHALFWYWTFTFPEVLWDKDEAERRFKPFKDLASRMGAEMQAFWEIHPKRGGWHVHVLIDKRLDVNWLRPWMVKRGWGPIMKAIRVQSRWVHVDGKGWVVDNRDSEKLCGYLLKYLLKGFKDHQAEKKKCFSASANCKAGNTRFLWNGKLTGKPGAMFYYYGRRLFFELYERCPIWQDMKYVLRLGYEACDWASFDFIYDPP